MLCCGAALLLMSSELHGTKPDVKRPASELLTRGKKIFEITCAPCHGKQGHGDGPVSANLRTKPWDLVRGVYHNRSTFAGKNPSDYDLYLTLTRGLHYTTMPFFRQMEMNDRWAVVEFIKTLSPIFSDTSRYSPPDTMSFTGFVPVSPKSLIEGRKIYAKECTRCHDKSNKSGTIPTMFDENGEPRPLIDLGDPSVYKYSESVMDVFRIVSTSVASHRMSAEDTWNVCNYAWSLRSTDQFPGIDENEK